MPDRTRPVAWIISKPVGRLMRGSRRVFGELCRDLADPCSCNPPHLTLEILYEPLPDVDGVRGVVQEYAAANVPITIPPRGVVHEADDALSIELELTNELLELRRGLAIKLRGVGAVVYGGPLDEWRPHLSVLGQEDPDLKLWSRIVPHPVLQHFTFPIQSLTISLPTDSPGEFREYGPYPLGGQPIQPAGEGPSVV